MGASLTKKFTWAGILSLPVVLSLGLNAESMFSSDPPDGRTGAPGEGLCTNCHASFPLNSGNGSLQISGIPDSIEIGQTVALTVLLQDPGQQRWGFELTALDSNIATAGGAGGFTITDPINTQVSDEIPPDRDYVKQTSSGTFAGTLNGPVSWQFNWTAPSEPGQVWFYATGNAANGTGSTSGDYIYTDAAVVIVKASPFTCGDADGSNIVTISDAVFLISYIFGGGPAPDPVLAGDADCSGIVTISDAVFLINYIFGGGPAPCSTCK